MRIVKQLQTLVALALLGTADVALADDTVVIVGKAATCSEAAPDHARLLADQASHDGAYQRAGECYLAAGEQALADQAFVKASAQLSGDTTRRLASNLSDVKAQARQMKEAFRHR
jgi:phage-related minor tail protein